jgi:hypothetical protein
VRVLVDPHRKGAPPSLLSQIPHRGDVEHICTGVAAHGLQPLQYFFRDLHGLAWVHILHVNTVATPSTAGNIGLLLSFYNGGASKEFLTFLTTDNTIIRLGKLTTDRAEKKTTTKHEAGSKRVRALLT